MGNQTLQHLLTVSIVFLVVTGTIVPFATQRGAASNSERLEEPTMADGDVSASIIDFNVDSGTFTPGQSVDATTTIENTGDTQHTFFVGYSVEGPDGGYYDNDGTTGTTVTLDPGEQADVSLSWTVESDAPSGTYDAITSVWKESDRDNLQTRLDSAERTYAFEVEQPQIDADITNFDVDYGTYRTGDAVQATATVENTGNTEHTFFVGYSVIGPDGEYYDNGGTTGQQVTLAAGEHTDVQLSWDVQDGAPAGIYDASTAVWEESDRDNLQTRLDSEDRYDAFEVEQQQIDAEISNFDVVSGTYRAGDTVEATATVENTGNTEHTFFVGYSVIGPDGEYYDNDGSTGQQVTLAAGEYTDIRLSWNVPSDVPDGLYDAKASVWEESDSSNLQTRLDSATSYDAFAVEQQQIDAEISNFAVDSGTYRVGDTVQATATVENTGNTEHTFFVGYSVIGPDGEYYDNGDSTGQRVTVAAGERTDVRLSWNVPSDVPAGTYDARTSVWKESDRDNLQTRLDSADQNYAFEVERESIDATVVDVDVDSGTYRTGDTVETTAVVKNTGNTEHTFFVGYSAVSPNGEYYDNGGGTGRQVTLAAGERTDVRLSWTVEDGVPTGFYDVNVAIWKESDRDNLQTQLDGVSRTDAFELEQQQVDAEINDFGGDSGTYRAGDTVQATATVENTGNTEHTFFVGYSVIGPDGEYYDNDGQTGETVTLAPDETQSLDLEWEVQSAAPSGSYGSVVTVWKESDRTELNTKLATATRNDLFSIAREDRARISSVDIGKTTYAPGETVSITVRVQNTRDGEQTFDVGFTATGSSRIQSTDNQVTRTVTIAPNAARDVELRWTVPSGAPSGEYNAVIRVKTAGSSDSSELLATQQQREAIEITAGDDLRSISIGDEAKGEIDESDPTGYRGHYEPITFDGTEGEYVTVEMYPDLPVSEQSPYLVIIGPEGDTVARKDGSQLSNVELPTTGEYTLIAASYRQAESDTFTYDIELREASPPQGDGELTVRVTDGAGGGIEGAEVSLSPMYESVDVSDQQTGPNGVATFTELTSDIYIVGVDRPGYDDSKAVSVDSSESNTASFVVNPTAQLSGRVMTTSGNKVAGASVRVIGEDVAAETGVDGSFNFDNQFQTGNYRLAVQVDGDRVHSQPLSVDQGGNSPELLVPEHRLSDEDIVQTSGPVDAASNWVDISVAQTEDFIYGDVDDGSSSALTGESEAGQYFYVEESGAYRTQGPCAWYRTEESCARFQTDVTSVEQATSQGVRHGFISGGEDTAAGIVETVKSLANPGRTITAIVDLGMRILNDLGLLEDIIKQIPQQVQQMQQEENPYSERNPELRDSFRRGWYAGYGGYVLVSSFVGGSVSNIISKTSKFESVTSKVGNYVPSRKQDVIESGIDLRKRIGSEATGLADLSDSQKQRVLNLHDSGDLSDAEIERLGGFVSDANSEYIASDAVDTDTILDMVESGEDITGRRVIAFRNTPEWAEGNPARLEEWRRTVVNYNAKANQPGYLDPPHVQNYVNNVVAASENPDISGTSELVENTNDLLSSPDPDPDDLSTHAFRSRNFEADMANTYADQSDVRSVDIEPDVGPEDASDVDLRVDRGETQEYVEVKDKTSRHLEDELVGGGDGNSIQDKFTDPDNTINCGRSDTICSADIRVRSDLTMTEIRTKVKNAFENHDEPIAIERLRIHTSDSDEPTVIEVSEDGTIRDITPPQNGRIMSSQSPNRPISPVSHTQAAKP